MQRMVLERILNRKRTGDKKDGYKIGLIFEGGGMRGSFSSGVACGLERLGFRDCFDIVYGSSAGSCAAAYFLSGEIEKGTTIYAENLSGRKFIKPWHFNEMMDLDYLCDFVMRDIKPLRPEALKKTDTLLKIFTSSAATGKPIVYTNFMGVDVLKIIKASCSAPFVCHPVTINGVRELDGNVSERMPIEEAVSDGCTDILVVATAPEDFREPNRYLPRMLKEFRMRHLSKKFKAAYKARHESYLEALDIAFGVNQKYPSVGIYTISPDFLVKEGETRREILKKLSDHGIEKATKTFKGAIECRN